MEKKEMPKLCGGMLLVYGSENSTKYVLMVNESLGYVLQKERPERLKRGYTGNEIMWNGSVHVQKDQIQRIYDPSRPTGLGYSGYEIVWQVVLGCATDDASKYLIWERTEDVKEMTVDEISKALGYTVKVVGAHK